MGLKTTETLLGIETGDGGKFRDFWGSLKTTETLLGIETHQKNLLMRFER